MASRTPSVNDDDDDDDDDDDGCCADVAKDPAQDSFVEKLIANVIKNLEVTVTNIHVRFEDNVTNPKKPFSVGVTLRELSLRVSLSLLFTVVVTCTDLFVYCFIVCLVYSKVHCLRPVV